MSVASATPSRSADAAAGILARHADNPSAFLALNAETRHFTVPGLDGLIAYRPAGRRHVVQLGGVFAAAHDAGRLLDAFLAAARRQGRRAVAVQALGGDVSTFTEHGYRMTQLGSNYAVAVDGFTLAGKRFVSLRNKLSRARRAGVSVAECGVDVPSSARLDAQLRDLDRQWLRAKGRHTKELTFMVGERGGPAQHLRRLFVARIEDCVVGYLSLSPVFGRHPGWLHDLSRRAPDAPPGTAELLTATAVERFGAEGAAWLHFGLTPFAGLADEHEVAGAASPLARSVVRLIAEHGAAVYPAADQEAYKQKWAPTLVQPEYVAVHGRVTPGAVWALLRLTRAV